jgi:hypothetical protein
MTLHDWGNPRRAKPCTYTADNLDDQMNDYGCLVGSFSVSTAKPCARSKQSSRLYQPTTSVFQLPSPTSRAILTKARTMIPPGTEMDVARIHAAPLKR